MTIIIIIIIIIILFYYKQLQQQHRRSEGMEDESKEEEAKYRHKYFLSSIGPSRPLQMFSSDRLNMKREYRFRCDPKKSMLLEIFSFLRR